MGDDSSLIEDVVQEDIDDRVVAAVDLSCYSLASTYDVLSIQWQPRLASPACGFGLFLCNELFPLPHAEEVLLDFSNHFHRPWRAIQSLPCLLEELDFNRPLVFDDSIEER